jgi:D-glycero-alpha-D-manno-heptose 1-phosphate guanylyltransferase
MALKEAIILAGGFGTRLKDVISDVPKPMAPINDEPFLNYLLNYLTHFKIERIILSTGYLHEKIEEYYTNLMQPRNWNGAEIIFSHEIEPLGTGGAIRLASEKCEKQEVLVINGDSFFNVNLDQFYKQHVDANAKHSLALREVENASRYGTVIIDDVSRRIISFKEKNGEETKGLINGGIYILNKNLFRSSTPQQKNFSIEKDFFEKQLFRQHIAGFEFDGYFIDIGIPEDYKKAQHEFKRFNY